MRDVRSQVGFAWIDLTPWWDTITSVAEERQRIKLSRRLPGNWTPDAHLLGMCGEFVYSRITGQQPDLVQRDAGDSGADFPDGCDVKATSNLKDPVLRVKVECKHGFAKSYALVPVDLIRKCGYLAGVWSIDEVLKAETRMLFGGRTYVLRAQKIPPYRKIRLKHHPAGPLLEVRRPLAGPHLIPPLDAERRVLGW